MRISRMGCLSTALEAISAQRALADGVHPELHVSMKTDGACAKRYGVRAPMASPDGRWLSYVRIPWGEPDDPKKYPKELVLLPLTPIP